MCQLFRVVLERCILRNPNAYISLTGILLDGYPYFQWRWVLSIHIPILRGNGYWLGN